MTVAGVATQHQEPQTETEKLAAMPHSERIQVIIVWILEGQSFIAIRDSIKEAWPAANPDSLLREANTEIDNAGGLHSESLRHIYQQMASIGDWSGAARVLKQRSELATEEVSSGVLIPQVQPSGPQTDQAENHDDIDLTELLDGLTLSDSVISADSTTPTVDPSFPFDPPNAETLIPKSQRGQGQTSKQELEHRYHQVARWLVQFGYKKGVVKKLAMDTWGIKWRTFEYYHTAAYKILNEAADVSHEEEFKRACLRYDHLMETSEDEKVVLGARKAKDELMGLHRPRKVAQVGRDGQIIDPVGTVNNYNVLVAGMNDDQLRKLAAANEVYQSIESMKGGVSVTNNASDAVPATA